MNKTIAKKLAALAKRFRALELEQAHIDFKRAQWAKDARAIFPNDGEFGTWCNSALGLEDSRIQDMCFRAQVGKIIPDLKTWDRLGGWRQFQAVRILPKQAQDALLEDAKQSKFTVLRLINDFRKLHPEYFPAPPAPTAPRTYSARAPSVVFTEHEARELQLFLCDTYDDKELPESIQGIVNKLCLMFPAPAPARPSRPRFQNARA